MPLSNSPKRPSRASHVGSLLRPKYLFEKRKALEAGECLPEDLRPFEDEAIKQVLKLQQEVGIETVTDGEMRRLVSRFVPFVLYPATRSTSHSQYSQGTLLRRGI